MRGGIKQKQTMENIQENNKMGNTVVKLSAPTMCIVDIKKKEISFEEYGEHILTISFDELYDIHDTVLLKDERFK